jgi:hypothetical protein
VVGEISKYVQIILCVRGHLELNFGSNRLLGAGLGLRFIDLLVEVIQMDSGSRVFGEGTSPERVG